MMDLTKMNYTELKHYLVICYYACAHDDADDVLDEMKKRPEYYEDED